MSSRAIRRRPRGRTVDHSPRRPACVRSAWQLAVNRRPKQAAQAARLHIALRRRAASSQTQRFGAANLRELHHLNAPQPQQPAATTCVSRPACAVKRRRSSRTVATMLLRARSCSLHSAESPRIMVDASATPALNERVVTTLACEPCGAACSVHHQRGHRACCAHLRSAQHCQSDVLSAAAAPTGVVRNACPQQRHAPPAQRSTAAKPSIAQAIITQEGKALRRRRREQRAA
jgi:hypothetical protein